MEDAKNALKVSKRLEEWEDWLKAFLLLNDTNPLPEYELIPHAAIILNDLYWRVVNEYIKPTVKLDNNESLIHFYKIISASEITVMYVLPLKFKNNIKSEKKIKRVNAEFAFFVSLNILFNWEIEGLPKLDDKKLAKILNYKETISKNDSYPKTFTEEHITWLETLNTAAPPPILLNSQTWRMVYLATHFLKK